MDALTPEQFQQIIARLTQSHASDMARAELNIVELQVRLDAALAELAALKAEDKLSRFAEETKGDV